MEVLILNLYFELLKTPVFTVEDVNKYYDNMDSARSVFHEAFPPRPSH